MPVLGPLSYTLEVPDLEGGLRFYTDAGLEAVSEGDVARLRCVGQERESVILIGGAPRKRLHHVALRADGLDAIARNVLAAGGRVTNAPDLFESNGLWVEDPHGVLFHLVERDADPELEQAPLFEINAPGRIVRMRRAAVKPTNQHPPALPRKLGHVVLFSPDVMASVRFVTDAFGMGLADHAQDVVAFTWPDGTATIMCWLSPNRRAIGFHHASFQVNDPDEVGRAGRALVAKAGRGDWGFGRHTVGSNYFHYIQDPWGSWFEYYSDMDHIDDYSLWTPTNYGPEDSMANWAPALPMDFIHNYEADLETA